MMFGFCYETSHSKLEGLSILALVDDYNQGRKVYH